MFAAISIEDFVKKNKEKNSTESGETLRAALADAVVAKEKGVKCSQCKAPIWAIGTAVVGWNGCFTCITGETDNSEDFEIDSVCF